MYVKPLWVMVQLMDVWQDDSKDTKEKNYRLEKGEECTNVDQTKVRRCCMLDWLTSCPIYRVFSLPGTPSQGYIINSNFKDTASQGYIIGWDTIINPWSEEVTPANSCSSIFKCLFCNVLLASQSKTAFCNHRDSGPALGCDDDLERFLLSGLVVIPSGVII